MESSRYESFGVNLSKAQAKKIINASEKRTGVRIRLSKNNSVGAHKLPLTKTQINRITKSKTGVDLNLSAAQLKYCEKTGGFLPLLALLPLLFGGLGAAGGVAGGAAAIANSVKTARAQNAAQAETERHNRAVEAELKAGSGILSNVASKIPVFGETIKYYLQKLGLGISDCNRIEKGECLRLGKGLYLGTVGSGLFLGPKSGSGLFLGPSPR